MIELIKEISQVITIPVLILFGIIMSKIWIEQRNLFKIGFQLHEQEKKVLRERIELLKENNPDISKLKDKMDLILKVHETEEKKLTARIEDLKIDIKNKEVDNQHLLNEINEIESLREKNTQNKYEKLNLLVIHDLNSLLRSVYSTSNLLMSRLETNEINIDEYSKMLEKQKKWLWTAKDICDYLVGAPVEDLDPDAANIIKSINK